MSVLICAVLLIVAVVVVWCRAYRLVGVVRGTQRWADAADQTYAFHLYEHLIVGRRWTAVGVEFAHMVKTRPEYVKVVKPWMDGLPLAECHRVNAREAA